MINAQEALEKLKQGNERFMELKANPGDISATIRELTAREGQSPFAVVICCADSRVIPEAIFCAGIGEIFVVRVAGNVIDESVLGSIEYACGHLHSPLVLVLGHTHCGAIGAALAGHGEHHVLSLTDKIHLAIRDEKDPDKATVQNVIFGVNTIKQLAHIDAKSVGGVYDISTGKITWLDE